MVSLYKCYRNIDIIKPNLCQYNIPEGKYVIYTLLCIQILNPNSKEPYSRIDYKRWRIACPGMEALLPLLQNQVEPVVSTKRKKLILRYYCSRKNKKSMITKNKNFSLQKKLHLVDVFPKEVVKKNHEKELLRSAKNNLLLNCKV